MAALAQAVMTAAAIDRTETRLEAVAAAIARRPDDRSHDLRTQRGGQHPHGDGRCGTAARSARRAVQVPRVLRARGMCGCEFGRHGLAEDDGTRIAQRLDGRRIAPGLPAAIERRAHLRRHVDRLDDVLDADRHAVDQRLRIEIAPARRRSRSRFARARFVQMHEGADLRFQFRDGGKAALEIVVRRVAPRRKHGARPIIGAHAERLVTFDFHRSSGSRTAYSPSPT